MSVGISRLTGSKERQLGNSWKSTERSHTMKTMLSLLKSIYSLVFLIGRKWRVCLCMLIAQFLEDPPRWWRDQAAVVSRRERQWTLRSLFLRFFLAELSQVFQLTFCGYLWSYFLPLTRVRIKSLLLSFDFVLRLTNFNQFPNTTHCTRTLGSIKDSIKSA